MAVPSGPPVDDGYAPNQIINMTVTNDADGNPVQVIEYYEGGASRTTNITYRTQT